MINEVLEQGALLLGKFRLGDGLLKGAHGLASLSISGVGLTEVGKAGAK